MSYDAAQQTIATADPPEPNADADGGAKALSGVGTGDASAGAADQQESATQDAQEDGASAAPSEPDSQPDPDSGSSNDVSESASVENPELSGADDVGESGAENDERVSALEAKLTQANEEKKTLTEQNKHLLDALTARNEADLAKLSDDDKALVTDLAGDDPLKVSAIYNKLKSSGKIGSTDTTAAPTHNANTGRQANGATKPALAKPASWNDADRNMARSVRSRATK